MIAPIFKAYDVRATYPDKLNESAAWKIGVGAGRFIKALADKAGSVVKLPNTVLVSRDMRPSSPSLAKALIAGLTAAGVDVIDLGMCDTSFQYFAINHLGAAGGIQTTASHNPINYNGFKMSGPLAKPIGGNSGLKDIEAIAQTLGEPDTIVSSGKVTTRDLWLEYRTHILSFYKPGKRKLRVYIDGSNGMAGKLVPPVFGGIDSLELSHINFEMNGTFVHEPNPLVAENMIPTQQGVRKINADMGVCFDGDADRAIITDEQGAVIGCDHLTGLLADYFLKQSPGAAVVYDLRSSKCVEEAILKLNGKPHKGRVGHVFMKALLRETQGVVGGELSGHFYFRDNFYADSGAITFAAVASILSQSDKPLSELIAPFKRYPQSGEINFKVEDKAGAFAAIKAKFGPRGSVDELDGVTVDAWGSDGWWFNVRASNTEPLMRLNAEGKDAAKLHDLMAELTPMLGTPVTGGH